MKSEHNRKQDLELIPDLPPHDRYYFGYQYGLGHDYIVPYLKSKGVKLDGAAICEIGCGEGGVLAALADEGATDVLGIDIRQEAIDRAANIFGAFKIPSEFDLHDVTGSETPAKWKERFDFVTLRDVIEHLDQTELSLRHVMDFLKPGGYLYIVFPPYYSPFGAHQHLLKTFWGRIPYMQFLPNALFKPMTSRAKYEVDIPEVARLRDIRLTIGKFRSAAKTVGLEIMEEELYFLRPVFKLKFGLPPIKANFLKWIPGIREVVALEASYLLRKPS
jgi:SAM-dependent methyltransferase